MKWAGLKTDRGIQGVAPRCSPSHSVGQGQLGGPVMAQPWPRGKEEQREKAPRS